MLYSLKWPPYQRQLFDKERYRETKLAALGSIGNAQAFRQALRKEEAGTISRVASRTIQRGDIITEQVIPVYCNCQMPEDKKRKMAQCVQCKDWYHQDCS